MNHLTTTEIFRIVDGTIANGEKTILIAHLEGCERCRRDVDFHRALGRAATEAPLASPSKGFTESVVRRVAPEKGKSWTTLLINNLGNIMAMGLVLCIVWYAIDAAPASNGSNEPSVISKAIATYVEYYTHARDAASKEMIKVLGEHKKEQPSRTSDVVSLTLISLLILIAIDRFVVRRITKTRV